MRSLNKMQPRNFPEQVIWYSIIGTYGFYLIGGIYIIIPAIAWILLGYFCKKLWEQNDTTPASEKIHIPLMVWIWVGGMILEEIALIMGHIDFDLGLAALIKSSIGWAKGWAFFAIFPLIGCLQIRPQLLYRAACIVCLQTLIFAPFFILAYFIHLPEVVYISPLKIVGGPGPEFFEFRFFEIDPDNGDPRWRLFTPWAPALGFVANIYFVFSLYEKDKKWRWYGIVGSIFMCLITASRLGILNLPTVAIATWALTRLSQPIFLIFVGVMSALAAIFASPAIEAATTFLDKVKSSRASSTEVRGALARIALNRFQEAPIWGHGAVERGPHLVQFMVIGSHSTFYGILFIKGIVGFIGYVAPLLLSFVDLLLKAQKSETAKVGLSIVLLLFFYSFAENLEMLAYLIWPGLVMLGIAFKDSRIVPYKP